MLKGATGATVTPAIGATATATGTGRYDETA
jgi:hypothetical protein